MKYRIGIDLGTNSLGWAAVQLSDDLMPRQLMDMGVRIFSNGRDPKKNSSNAVQRREVRGMRRNRDRRLGRGGAMIHTLIDAGLMPKVQAEQKLLKALDPWILRTLALDEELELFEIGRALFHLQKRRGFKSNRKTDGDSDGTMLKAIEKTRKMLEQEGARTLGELYGRPRLAQYRANKSAAPNEGKPLPKARVKARAVGSKISYDYYPDRAMILDEFDLIWAQQADYHPNIMNEEARENLRHIIEFQRPLKPQSVGKCTFIEGEPRAPKALPSAQYARVLEEVNNLKVGAAGYRSEPLTEDQRHILIEFLMNPTSKQGQRTFKSIRKKLGFPESQIFSHESRKRKHLVGDATAARLIQDDAWGKGWADLPRHAQDEIVIHLLETEEEAELIDWLTQNYDLSREQALAVSNTRLPQSHGKLSILALSRLIPRLEAGQRYDEAASAEFEDHRALGTGVVYQNELPYYGKILSRYTAHEKENPKNPEEKFGRINNPTVHVALNELRKVMNDLIRRWGPPAQTVLELARDLPLSARGLTELESEQSKNQTNNEKRNACLEELNCTPNHANRLKLRLYEEAEKAFKGFAVCVFTGRTINKTDLFTSNIEIEHILPLSKTLDDSFTNKVLSFRDANRIKKNNAPFEAFGHNPGEFNWEDIAQRAGSLPEAKIWRFAPDAMERWEDRGGGFLARQLNDTRYISRLGKTFMEALFEGQGRKGQARQVWAVPGRLTSDLRQYAGFNKLTGLTGSNRKDRTDHRHHAVDALIVALTDQAMVKCAADLSKREDPAQKSEIMKILAQPLKRYRKSAEDRLSKLIVSHKPDHGFHSAMHNETAYGILGETDEKGAVTLVTRKSLENLSQKEVEKIVDPVLRQLCLNAIEGLSKKAFKEALLNAGQSVKPQGVHSVRIHACLKPSSFITVQHGKDGEHHKAYKGDSNYCYDIWVNHKGKWTGEVITTFQAYQMAQKDENWWQIRKGLDGQNLLMRLRKGDMLEIEGPAGRQCVIVYKFSKGRIQMAEHMQANSSARIREKKLRDIIMAPSSLQKAKAVSISVSPSGKVKRHK